MNLLINIALLSLGFMGTLAAFGGETWKTGSEPILKRVTTRGWISIVLLTLTLVLGILKEVRGVDENAALKEEISDLQGQLKHQKLLLASKRLAELREQDLIISEYQERLASALDVYTNYKSFALSVTGRASGMVKHVGLPEPFEMEFIYNVTDFHLGVCDSEFKAASPVPFLEAECSAANLLQVLEDLPNASFERGPFGPGVVAILHYLKEIRLKMAEVLNGPTDLAGKDSDKINLSDLLGKIPAACGVPVDLVSTAKREDPFWDRSGWPNARLAI